MSTKQEKNAWEKEFDRIKKNKSFSEFYCEKEDEWLQYSDWNSKIPAVFGSYKNAVLQYRSSFNSNKKVHS